MIDFRNNTRLLANNPTIKLNNKWYMYIPWDRKILIIPETTLDDKEKIENFLNINNIITNPITKKCIDIDEYIISLVVTRDCNLWCLYCFARWWEFSQYMNFDKAKSLIDQVLKNKNIKKLKITFFWWEPTLNFKLIKEVVEYCKSLKNNVSFSYHITTNGVTNENVRDFLIENKIWITISSDGANDIQDTNRPLKLGWWSSTYLEKSIKYLISKNKIFKIRVTITNETVDKMVDTVEYFHKLWCQIIHIEPMNTSWRWDKLTPPTPAAFIKNFSLCLDYAKDKNMKLVNSTYLNLATPSYHYCWSAVWDKVILTPDGTLSACFEVQSKNEKWWELFCIWEQTENWELNYKLKNQEKLSELSVDSFKQCTNCFAKYICSGWCPVRNFKQWLDGEEFKQCAFKKWILYEILKRIVENSLNN